MKEENFYCCGKRAYDKKGAVTAKNKRYHEDRVILRIYPCSDHWHLTKQVKNRGERKFRVPNQHMAIHKSDFL